MKTITVDESRICAVLDALAGMDKCSAWSPLIIAGLIATNCSDRCRVAHSMEIKWPLTGSVTRVMMTLECGPEVEITEGEFKPTLNSQPNSLTA